MSVYVDGLKEYSRGQVPGARRAKYWGHMFADSAEELHAAALAIDMKREWFQISRNGIPHYDLTKMNRKRAIKKGAIVLDRLTLADLQRFRWIDASLRK